jgi:glycosyltransferase involved in cell wall biosynthesis
LEHEVTQDGGAPRFSVLTTSKGEARFLGDVLASLRAQSFRDFEFVLVDDNDAPSPALAAAIAGSGLADRTRLVWSGAIGRVRSLNLGVQESTGAYVAILDDDDIWAPAKLQEQDRCIFALGADVIGTREIRISAGTKYRDVAWQDSGRPSARRIGWRDLLVRGNTLTHSSVCVRRTLGLYDERFAVSHDYELWVRLMQANRILAIVEAPLTGHRTHFSSFDNPKSWRRHVGHYAVSVRVQWNAIWRSRRFQYAIFPLLRIVTYGFRVGWRRLKLRRSGTGQP